MKEGVIMHITFLFTQFFSSRRFKLAKWHFVFLLRLKSNFIHFIESNFIHSFEI